MPGLLALTDGRSSPPVLVLATIGLVVVLVAIVRVVPGDERLVVTRRGRVRRVLGPGLVVVLPGVGGTSRVSLAPAQRALVVHATTTDQVPLTVLATARFRVVDPASTIHAGPDGPVDAAGQAVEEALDILLSTLPLAAVPASRSLLEQHLPPQLTACTRRWGVDVDSLQVTGVETQVSATMLDAARHEDDACS